MSDRPILFSAPMVRAILDGRKTQTRRPVRWRGVQPGLNLSFTGLTAVQAFPGAWELESPTRTSHEHRSEPTRCPYGQPGDRLWVRETWAYGIHALGWRPSIHMPRSASRITLINVGVRVERLMRISDADAQAEGTPCYVCGGPLDGTSEADCHCFHAKARASDYRYLWEAINGPGSWDANPFVWVVEFRRAP